MMGIMTFCFLTKRNMSIFTPPLALGIVLHSMATVKLEFLKFSKKKKNSGKKQQQKLTFLLNNFQGYFFKASHPLLLPLCIIFFKLGAQKLG